MYDRFDPLGAALGLPPFALEARQSWIRKAVQHIANIGAFSPKGEVVGHSFLAGSHPPGPAEVAVFVHQEFRRNGIGTALLTNALEFGRALQLEAVWAVTDTANRAALRLLDRCGFRLRQSDVDIAEFEIDLRALPSAWQS